ncbi:MAG: GrpB family protein, partial [Roseiflexaceae bacterium]
IAHVGSTAVPGLAAKPIIDMDIVMHQPADIASIIAALAPLGYVHRGDLGIAGREAFDRPTDTFPHHLYLGLASAASIRNHLLLRDYLRQHPAAAQAYGQLKQQLAQQHPDDIDAYVAGKSQFIADILTQQGMLAADVTDIQRQNRA